MRKTWFLTLTAMLANAAFQAAWAAPAPLTGFLDTIGGTTDPKAIDARPPKLPDPIARPLIEHRRAVADYRFFREKLTRDGTATALTAREAFGVECAAAGGVLEPDGGAVELGVADRFVGKLLVTGRSYGWHRFAAVCAGPAGEALGGFVAIVLDNSGLAHSDLGSALLHRISPLPTQTAIYALQPSFITSRADLIALQSKRQKQAAADMAFRDRQRRDNEARQAAFRARLQEGAATNCGMVIELRREIAQVQAPANVTPPGGERIRWVRRDRLTDDNQPCPW